MEFCISQKHPSIFRNNTCSFYCLSWLCSGFSQGCPARIAAPDSIPMPSSSQNCSRKMTSKSSPAERLIVRDRNRFHLVLLSYPFAHLLCCLSFIPGIGENYISVTMFPGDLLISKFDRFKMIVVLVFWEAIVGDIDTIRTPSSSILKYSTS